MAWLLTTLIVLLLASHQSTCSLFTFIGEPINNCTLEPTTESRAQFQQRINDEVLLMYLKLNFINTTFESFDYAYLQNTTDIIDPLTWELAFRQNGRALLQSPFDFGNMSLGTLSALTPIVRYINLNIATPPECFEGSTDRQKLFSITDMIRKMTKEGISDFNENNEDKVLEAGNFDICTDVMSDSKRYVIRHSNRTENLFTIFANSHHKILQLASEHNCVSISERNATIYRIPIHRTFVTLSNVVMALIVLFSPYLLLVFVGWKNPPKDGKIRLDSRPFPFGFFFFVFYSTFGKSSCLNNNVCVFSSVLRHTLFLCFMIFFCCIQLIPFLYVDPENYTLRQRAAERMGVLKFDSISYGMTYLAVAMILVHMISFQLLKHFISRWRLNQTNTNLTFNKIGKSYLTSELIFTQKNDNAIVEIICPEGGKDVFSNSIRDTWNLLPVLKLFYNGKRNIYAKILLLPVILAYWIGQTIPFIYFTNEVMVLLVSLAHNAFSPKKKLEADYIALTQKDKKVQNTPEVDNNKQQTIKDVVLLYLTFLPFLLSFFFVSVPVFCELFKNGSILVNIITYTFTGVIVNAGYVVGQLAILTGIVFFVVQTVTGYLSTYVELFYKIVKISERTECSAVSHDTDGVPQIDLDFFFHIAYKLKPWKKELLMTYLQLAFAAMFFLLGYWLLEYVNELHKLERISQVLGACVIGGLLPIAKLLSEPPAIAKCKNKAEKRQLQQLIKMYDQVEKTEAKHTEGGEEKTKTEATEPITAEHPKDTKGSEEKPKTEGNEPIKTEVTVESDAAGDAVVELDVAV